MKGKVHNEKNYRLLQFLSVIVLFPLGASAAITGTYVDATINNTTNAEGSAAWYTATASSTDGLWRRRTDYGEGGTIFEAYGGEPAPMLKTTLTGLAPGALYNMRAIYTINVGTWRLLAGFDPDYLVLCVQASGVYTGTDYGTSPQYECLLGVARADQNGNLEVLIDNAAGQRNWYDGVSYERTTRANAPFAYVNATAENTTNHLGGVWVTNVADHLDNLWQDRSTYPSSYYNVFEAHKAEDAPLLRTTHGGLPADAMYDVYFYYGSHTNGKYRIQAGLSPDALTQYDINNGTATGFEYREDPKDLLQYRAALGRVTVSAEGEIAVYIDDLVAVPDRAWYDGIALQLYIPFGTTFIVR